MQDDERERSRTSWARLRFAIVGPLLAAPPTRGELQAEIARLAEKSWRHPRTGEPVRFGRSTIERWLYAARASRDPVAALARAVRRDRGSRPSLPLELRTVLRRQYEEHPTWTVRLHYDNLPARLAGAPELRELPLPSYHSVARFLRAEGLIRKRPARRGARRDEMRRAAGDFEVRSFEVAHTHALWHADFHHGSRKVLTAGGQLVDSTAGLLPRRSLPPRLPSPVVPRGDGRVLRARAHPGNLETRAPARASDRQRRGDARRRDPRRARAARHRAPPYAGLRRLPERQARGLLGSGRGTAPGRCSKGCAT